MHTSMYKHMYVHVYVHIQPPPQKKEMDILIRYFHNIFFLCISMYNDRVLFICGLFIYGAFEGFN